MSKRRGRQTAETFMTELERDPEYQRVRAEKDKQLRLMTTECDQMLEPVLLELNKAGFSADSIQSFVKQYAPLSEISVAILLKSLKQCQDERIRESLVRALGAANAPFDGQPLVELFESTSNEGLRFAILNSIALARPHSIDEWLEKARQNDYLRRKLSDLGYDWETL